MSQAFDDLVDQFNSLQDASDNNQPTIDAISSIQQPDGTFRAQLDFPLDPQSASRLPSSSLMAPQSLWGTVTVSDNRILASSTILISRAGSGGTLGHLSLASQQNGSFIINSSSGSDTSTINYVAFN